ncbi:class A beta-lactamase [Amycolatopsis aidingensis]|uniref:class A beta-lactamase n=1 Tax=Amycolatopsis aidingensis TaxID=2842453 RepID=UPI001C0BBCB2|nr:class A beta-lactamase [Amycolatopsis aidingensis]
MPGRRSLAGSPARRTVLLGGLATLAACTARPTPTPPTHTRTVAGTAAAAELTALEDRFGGRLGVYAIDTGTGATVRHRADERFLMCSTHKLLVAAAVLRSHTREPGLLDRLVRYDDDRLIAHSPVTTERLATGMTVAALCRAAVTHSDNAASNLLVDVLGGPQAVTSFVRTLGDPRTRLDRREPELNRSAHPGDQRDTTTPTAIGADLRALVLGEALDPPGRDRLTGWLRDSTTGGELIRAGLPRGWLAGDKSGSGPRGEVNDVAVVWPPGSPPLVLAVYTAPADPDSTTGAATVAAAAKIVAANLGPAS